MDERVIQAGLAATLDHYGITVGRGREAAIRCPAHDDAHASASANIDKGVWFCHACGAGGNALHIIAEREGVSLREAYEVLGNLGVVASDDLPRTATRVRSGRKAGTTKWTPPRLRRVG